MVKAKEFWSYLCDVLNYRFFAGVPCKELTPLYNKMKSDFMHYVPCSNETIALGLASGVWMSGIKGGVLLHVSEIYTILKYYNDFNNVYNVPGLMLVGYNDDDQLKKMSFCKIAYRVVTDDYEKQLKFITHKIETKQIPCALMIKEGVLK